MAERIRVYLFDSPHKPLFTEFFNNLSSPRSAYHVKTFGLLTALLTAGNLALAGALSMPSIEEFASCVARVNSGATKGLDKLGLLTSSTREVHAAQFVKAHQYLESTLSHQEDIKFSMFMTEHALCKYSCIHKYKRSGGWVSGVHSSGINSREGKVRKRKCLLSESDPEDVERDLEDDDDAEYRPNKRFR